MTSFGEHDAVSHRPRAIFLDVDGTYAHLGVVPEAHVRAVRAVRAAGHRVLLCTGRPEAMLSQGILDAGFDGLVASAGAFVRLGEEVVLDRRVEPELAARMVKALDVAGAVYVLEAQEALYVAPALEARLRESVTAHFGEAGAAGILAQLQVATNLGSVRFAKISVTESPVPVDELARSIGPEVGAVASSLEVEGIHTGELFRHGISKADGLAAVIERLGLSREDTIAVGDGENDLEMLEYAGLGVAVEGSPEAVIRRADRLAAPPQQAGLATLFDELGLYA